MHKTDLLFVLLNLNDDVWIISAKKNWWVFFSGGHGHWQDISTNKMKLFLIWIKKSKSWYRKWLEDLVQLPVASINGNKNLFLIWNLVKKSLKSTQKNNYFGLCSIKYAKFIMLTVFPYISLQFSTDSFTYLYLMSMCLVWLDLIDDIVRESLKFLIVVIQTLLHLLLLIKPPIQNLAR